MSFVPSTDFSKWLNDQMERSGLTQEALANKVDVSHVTVSKWQRGKHTPDPGRLLKLAEVFNEKPLRLFNMVYGLPLNGDSEKELHPLIRAAVREMDDLSEEGIRLVIDQMRHVLKKRYPKDKK